MLTKLYLIKRTCFSIETPSPLYWPLLSFANCRLVFFISLFCLFFPSHTVLNKVSALSPNRLWIIYLDCNDCTTNMLYIQTQLVHSAAGVPLNIYTKRGSRSILMNIASEKKRQHDKFIASWSLSPSPLSLSFFSCVSSLFSLLPIPTASSSCWLSGTRTSRVWGSSPSEWSAGRCWGSPWVCPFWLSPTG